MRKRKQNTKYVVHVLTVVADLPVWLRLLIRVHASYGDVLR